jgi:UDP-glucose 4-epimerase
VEANRRILVTGVARWWGALLVQRLLEEPDVAEVIGIDTREPHYDLGRADFLHLDIRHSLIGKLVRAVGIDTVVHTGTTIDSFDLDPRRAHETNVIGTLNLLAGCAGADSPVRNFILKSSGHVYGSRHTLPAYLREDRRLAVDSPHAFVRDIVEVESYLNDFALRNPSIRIAILRFANSLNADEPQPLARYLDLELVPTVAGFDPVIQLIDRDDCIDALRLATIGPGSGAYNIAAPRPVALTALLDAGGKLHAPLLPPLGTSLAASALHRLGVAFLSPQLVDLLKWGRTLSTARAERELDFRPRLDTVGAYERFLQDRRVLPFRPDRQTYQYEKELEDFIHARRPEELADNGRHPHASAESEPPGGKHTDKHPDKHAGKHAATRSQRPRRAPASGR